MEGRGGAKGFEIYDFYSPCLFKQSSLKVFSPFHLTHFIGKNKGTLFFFFSPPFNCSNMLAGMAQALSWKDFNPVIQKR